MLGAAASWLDVRGSRAAMDPGHTSSGVTPRPWLLTQALGRAVSPAGPLTFLICQLGLVKS